MPTELFKQYSFETAFAIVLLLGVAWVGRQLFGRDGLLRWTAQRIAGDDGIVTRYVSSSEAVRASLIKHMDATDATMGTISETQCKVAEIAERIDQRQDKVLDGVMGINAECHEHHRQMIADLAAQGAHLKEELKFQHNWHSNPEGPPAMIRLVEATCSLLDLAGEVAAEKGCNCGEELNTIKAKLRG